MSDKEYQTVTDSQICAYMALLGLEILTPENLTLSYRSLMRTQHVDKGGNLQMTQTITQAYRILKLCLENNRYVPSSAKNSKPGPSTSNSNNYDQYQAYANTDDSWAQYSKCFKPKTRNPKYFFKPTKFDKAFQNGWQHPEDAEDPVNGDLGKARSKPKKYNNGYMYEDDDEYIPNDRQNYSTKNDGEPRVIRGGLELRKPLSGIELPDNYDQLSQSDIKLNELTKVELQTNPQLEELYTLLSSFEKDPSFDTLMQRTRTFIYLDWAQSNQSDTTQYQNIAIEQNKLGIVTITLPQFEEDDIVDDRLKEGAIIQLYSAVDLTIKAKATVETVDWDLHKITVSFSSKLAGDKLLSCGHRCNISMAPSRFIYRAFIRGLNAFVHNRMIDYIYPDPQFEEPYEDFSNIAEQRITDRETHQQSHGSILFNHNQELAIDAIVNSTCGNYPFLLFGPPGTGKTATLVECIHRITKIGKEKRILVCTPSNMAADVIAATILQRGFIEEKYVFRLNSLSFEYKKRNKMLDSIACIVKEGSTHCFGIPSLRNLQVFRVIITTLTSSTYLSMAGGLRGYFSHILIDESAQATEQELMIPIGNLAIPGKTTVALYGDPKQLGAVDRVPVLGEFGYNQSVMERLLKLPAYQSSDHRLFVMLEQNYRTHGLILRPASRLFYAQKLISMKTDKSLYEMCGWEELPNPSFPVIFHSIRGSREIRSASSSYKNHYENDLCLDYIKKLQKHGVQLHEIGIISPYKFQCTMIKDYLQNYKLYGITVNSVEGFQGSERRVIIFLTTRTNSMGFLSCDKRLNTSITRAQQLLIILGDEELLSRHVAWNHFIHYCRFHGGFRESTLMGASTSEKKSPPPGFKAITCQTTAPPGFGKPENTGVPVDVESAKDINTAYNNTTEEMKAEYDVDDDHDFDLTCNVRASEYINFQGTWVDETIEIENIEPEAQNGYNRECYEEAERVVPQNGYSKYVDVECSEFYDTYEELPPSSSSGPPGYDICEEQQRPYFDDSQVQEEHSPIDTVENLQQPHPYDTYEEQCLPQDGEAIYRSQHVDRSGHRQNYQYDYDLDSDSSPRRSQHNGSRNESDNSRHYDDYYRYQDEQRHPPQYQNGYDPQYTTPQYDAYEQRHRNDRSNSRRYDEDRRYAYGRNDPHYVEPEETRYRQYQNYEQQNGERSSHQYGDRERNPSHDYDCDRRYHRTDSYYDSQKMHGEPIYDEDRYHDPRYSTQYDAYAQPQQNGGRSSRHYQYERYEEQPRSPHQVLDDRAYRNRRDDLANGQQESDRYRNDQYYYERTYAEPCYEEARYDNDQYEQINGYPQDDYHRENERVRWATPIQEVYQGEEESSVPVELESEINHERPSSTDTVETAIQVQDEEEIDVFLSNLINGTNPNAVNPIAPSDTNERKLSSEDLDDIAALYGNDRFRFRAETSDIMLGVDDFNTLADEILEKLQNTSA